MKLNQMKHAHRTDATAKGRLRRAGERGASLVEYALMVALVAVVCIGAVTMLGTKVKGSTYDGAGCNDGYHAVAQDGDFSNTGGGSGANYKCVPN